MFTDQLNESWDSTENQDAFIKEYFGKVEVLSQKGLDKGTEKGQWKKIHSVQKSKSQSCEDSLINFVSNSSQIKRKHSLLSSDSKFSKKKLKKFISSFEEDSGEINENEIGKSSIVNLPCQISKKEKLKNKSIEKDFLLLSNDEKISLHTDDIASNNSVTNLDIVEKGYKSQKSKRKKRLKNKNGTEKHQEDSLLNWNDEELEKNGTEIDSKVVKPHRTDNVELNTKTVAKEQLDIVDSRKQKSKKKRSKNKNIHKEDSSNNEKLEEHNEMEVDSKVKKPNVVCGIPNILSTNKSSTFQNKIHQRFQAAKFRYLNEMLYKSPGQEALSYFQENTDEFEDYHIGYQSQVSKWPVNPVDIIIQEIRQMNKEAVIADLGCGEGKIAEAFPKRTVHSFDLIALKESITACDMANVPLQSNSVDIAVFCLSLMGTNWKDYIRESHRILKPGATLKIAEIESRIENVNYFIKNIESFGFSLENQDLSHKMFIFLNFRRTSKSKKKAKVPDVTLKPCLYKKR